jgi:hypothetical protein
MNGILFVSLSNVNDFSKSTVGRKWRESQGSEKEKLLRRLEINLAAY